MRLTWLILLIFLCPAFTQAQTITGKITSKESKSPVARASVFLSNSSFGTISSAQGTFTLNNVRPGQYTLVVTVLGFTDFTKIIVVNDGPINIDIVMEPKMIELREVVISGNKGDWKRNYEQFKKEFIGTDENAKNCEIANPSILNIVYHKNQQTLEVDADNFLIVENRGLGYRVKFLLRNFKSDKISGTVTYAGERLFEELPGNAQQKKRWQINRDMAYYGSPMHFYRSLYQDKLKEEGFDVRRLTRYMNEERPSDEVIHRKIEIFTAMRRGDSVNHYITLANLSKYAHERIATVPWASFELLRSTETPGIFAITYPNYLYVIYTKKRDETNFKDIFRPLDMPNYEISVATLPDKISYSLFDKNGIVVDNSPLYEGTWSKARLSELLPVDYQPTDKR